MSNLRRFVSIIVPVWGDYIKFLPECLNSLENQTVKPDEIIVVNEKTDLPSARNYGVNKAKYEYCLCLDVDDRLKPNAIERMIEEGVDITAFSREDQNGREHELSKDLELSDFLKGNRIIACSMFKKKVWEDIGGYDEAMVYGYEDWDFWVRALKAGYKVTPINEILYIQNFREDSMINETIKKHEELSKYIKSKK